jgi:hypothetical protein
VRRTIASRPPLHAAALLRIGNRLTEEGAGSNIGVTQDGLANVLYAAALLAAVSL